MRYVVIGGGLSGLAAAFYLRRGARDAEVIVCEASPRIGGLIQTEQVDQFLVEHGADMFSSEPDDALQLCQDLGVADELIHPAREGRGAMIVRDNRLYTIPEGFVLMRPTRLTSMLTTPLLSVPGKLRLLRERFVPQRKGSDDESVASFVRRRFGDELLTRIVQPLVGGIYTADPERLSMSATMRPFVQMEQQYGSLTAATLARRRSGADSNEKSSSGARYSQFRGFAGGMKTLFQHLLNSLPDDCVRLSAPVLALARSADRWRVVLSDSQVIDDVDGIILAVPTNVAAGICRSISTSAATELEGFQSASSVILVVGAKDQTIARIPSTFGFVVPARERRHILACSFASHKFAGRTPPGHTLMRIFLGGALQPEVCSWSDDRLFKVAAEELGTWIGWNGRAVIKQVVRWNDAMPQYCVGHLERVAKVEACLREFPSLVVAGNGLYGVGIAPVVARAKRAAAQVAQATYGMS